ncbi:MAG: hypothetical protein WC752_04615 [Patescibacteria group bacterium]|jgi:hypothetical protein
MKKILLFLLLVFPLATVAQDEYSLSLFEKFTGVDAGDSAAWPLSSAGDVDNDGYDDFLVSSPFTTNGTAYLIYGQSDSLASASLSTFVKFSGEASGDGASYSVSGAGDVNSDGYDDILISATSNDNGGGINAGAVYLIYGKSEQYTGTTSLGSLGTNGAKFTGEVASASVGEWTATAGDINNDGFDDFLASAPKTVVDAGTIYLIYGKSEKYSGTTSFGSIGSNGAKFIGEAGGDTAGYCARTAGDVNNDGFDDFITGAAGNHNAGGADAGAAYLIYGQSAKYSGSNTLGSLGAYDTKFTGEAADDSAGYAVSSAGDVNNDGFFDILIGSDYNDESFENAGATYLIYGQTENLTDASLSTAVRFTGEAAGDRAGYSTSPAGDVNGDNYDDILIGAFANGDGGVEAGAAYLIYGQDDLLTNASLSTAIEFMGETGSDYAGDGISSAGDVNGDGFDEILVGADGYDGGDYTGVAYLGYLYIDSDGDGLAGSSGLFSGLDTNDNDHDNDGSETGTDCNDDDATVSANQTYYQDADGDGLGNLASPASFCSLTAPEGYTDNITDTNDNDHDNDGSETGVDCNDNDASLSATTNYFVDSDGDGYGSITSASICSATMPAGYSTNNTDCSDTDSTINANQTYYQDLDGDGLGNPLVTTLVCASVPPTGYVTNSNDTNDAIKDILTIVAGVNGDITITYVNNDTSVIDVFSYIGSDEMTLKQYQDNYYLVLHPKAKKLALIDINALTVLFRKTLSKKSFPTNSLKTYTLRNKPWAVITAKNKNNKVKLSLVKIVITQEKLGKKVSASLVNKKIIPSKTKKNKNTILLRSKKNKIITKYLLTKKINLKEI